MAKLDYCVGASVGLDCQGCQGRLTQTAAFVYFRGALALFSINIGPKQYHTLLIRTVDQLLIRS